jgi:hypothetical protein
MWINLDEILDLPLDLFKLSQQEWQILEELLDTKT